MSPFEAHWCLYVATGQACRGVKVHEYTPGAKRINTSVTLVSAEISWQLLERSPSNIFQIFMVPWRRILLILVILWFLLWYYKQLSVFSDSVKYVNIFLTYLHRILYIHVHHDPLKLNPTDFCCGTSNRSSRLLKFLLNALAQNLVQTIMVPRWWFLDISSSATLRSTFWLFIKIPQQSLDGLLRHSWSPEDEL